MILIWSNLEIGVDNSLTMVYTHSVRETKRKGGRPNVQRYLKDLHNLTGRLQGKVHTELHRNKHSR